MMEMTSGPGLGDYIAALKRRRNLIFGVAIPIVALGAMLALGLPAIYQSSGFIQLEDEQNRAENGDSQAETYADEYVASIGASVLNSASLRTLLETHEIYDDQDTNREAAVQRLKKDIHVNIVTTQILDPRTGRERDVVSAFTVAFDHRDPQRAFEGARWVVDAYLAANRRDRQQQAETAAKFYGKEAERVRQDVANLESKLADFKRTNAGALPELTEVNMGSMERTERDLRDAEVQLQALRRERVLLVSQLQQARAAGPEATNVRALEDEYARKSIQYDASHPDLVSLRRQIEMAKRGGSSSTMSLQQQLTNERAVLTEVRQRYSEDHPDVKRLQRNIKTLEARIASGESAGGSSAPPDSPVATQLQAQLNATDTQIGALQARSLELRTRMTQLEARLSMTPQVEREYQTVTRDLASARAKYDELVKRRMDAEVSEAAIQGGRADRFRVVTAPSVPNQPAKPQRLALLLIALVLGGVIGVSAAVAREAMDQTVRGSRDVRDILNVSPLAAVPMISNSIAADLRKKRLLRLGTCAVAGVVAAYLITVQLIV
jgi:polysaccharide biosynthesis transport protein